MRSFSLHLLSLIYTRDEEGLANFLADVKNVNKLRIRALRLGGWRYLSPIERGIIYTVVRSLTRIRSSLLLNTLVKIFMKILPYLLTRFERKFMENLDALKESLDRALDEVRDLYLHRLRSNIDYLLTQAWKYTVAEYTGAWIQ